MKLMTSDRKYIEINSIVSARAIGTSDHDAVVIVTNVFSEEMMLIGPSVYIEAAEEAAELINQLCALRTSGKECPMTWDDFNASPLAGWINERMKTSTEIARGRKAEAERRKAEAKIRADAIADMGVDTIEIDLMDDMLAAS